MDKEIKEPRVIISGGGTGGHIFPALSIAAEIKRRYPQSEILFVGAEGRMEMEKVPQAGFPIVGLPVNGFDRKHLLRNVKVLWHLWVSMIKSKSVLSGFNPDIAVGVGGYASGPLLKSAQKQGIPTIIQEQNSYPGVTNKMLAGKADAICVAYTGLEKYFPASKITLTGNPVRPELLQCTMTQDEARVSLGLKPGVPTVLVIGGSLGARTINHSIGEKLGEIAKSNVQVLWQCGKQGDEYSQEVLKASNATNVTATPFISNMAAAYKAADLVVSRAGAGTISELQLLGKAAILVPSPNVAEDHQTHNAMALVNNDAAVLVRDADAQSKLVDKMLALVADKEQLDTLSRNISAMALTDSAARIVDIMDGIIAKNKK